MTDKWMQRKRLWIWLGVAILVLLPVLDFVLVDKAKAHTQVEQLPGFWAVFGLLGCFLLVLGSKALGAAGLQRKEDDDV